MNKKTIIGGTFAAVAAIVAASSFISCSSDDESDDYYYNLDVTSRTPTTRSANMDGDFSFVGVTGLYDVPKNPDECMLYAIISIAAQRHIPITTVEPDGKGDFLTKTHTIGKNGYTASSAYAYVKGLATSQQWTPCDVSGNPIPDSESYSYTGGAMSPSVAASIAKQSGILQGTTVFFKTYGKLQEYISTDSFKKEHPAGSYIINSDSQGHASIGRGLDKNGYVKYTDAEKTNSSYKTEEETAGSWTLIF